VLKERIAAISATVYYLATAGCFIGSYFELKSGEVSQYWELVIIGAVMLVLAPGIIGLTRSNK